MHVLSTQAFIHTNCIGTHSKKMQFIVIIMRYHSKALYKCTMNVSCLDTWLNFLSFVVVFFCPAKYLVCDFSLSLVICFSLWSVRVLGIILRLLIEFVILITIMVYLEKTWNGKACLLKTIILPSLQSNLHKTSILTITQVLQ